MKQSVDIQTIASHLSDPQQAEDSRTFPADPAAADRPGLYSWWADETAVDLFSQIGHVSPGHCIYVGQAGATQPSGKRSSATLKSRIRGNHIRGSMRSSTFRMTLSALLLEPLSLRLTGPERLVTDDNTRVSEWIRDHLTVAVVPLDDRDTLKEIEQQVLNRLDPPLNLSGLPRTGLRRRLSVLRGKLKQPDRFRT